MKRTLIVFVLVMAAGGFALGWLLSNPTTPEVPVSRDAGHAEQVADHHQAAAALVPTAVEHRFRLSADDVRADRETPAIAVDAAGRVVVAWASQSGPKERTLYVTRSTDQGKTFETPVAWRKIPIYFFPSRSEAKPAEGGTAKPAADAESKPAKKAMVFSTHVLPRLVATPDATYLGWVEAIDGGPTVRFLVARSSDGGKTFAEPTAVHSAEAGKPGFTALALGADGALCAGWLDSRGEGPLPFYSEKPGFSEGFSAERLVFGGPSGGKGVCPCCDVAVTRGADGTSYVAFRNSDSGHRDIWLARQKSGANASFEPAVPMSGAHWEFQGCPHDAPSLAIRGDAIHAVWMDGHSGRPRVYAASAPLASLEFSSQEVSPESAGAQGHPRLIADAKGDLLAVWDESLDPAQVAAAAPAKRGEHSHGHAATGSGRVIMFSRAGEGGKFPTARMLSPRPGAFQLNPAVAAGGAGETFVAWNELDADGKSIVVRRVDAQGASR